MRMSKLMAVTLLAGFCVCAPGALRAAADRPEREHTTVRVNPALEPNIEIAKSWWDELPKKWTMLGWKAHITRFNVLYDGTLINTFSFDKGPQNPVAIRPPIPEPSAQFSFVPAPTVDAVPKFDASLNFDFGDVVQGWEDRSAPVLWSEWQYGGYLLRESVFAHVPGGRELERGDEPLFAWVRLSVHYAADAVPLENAVGFGIRINRMFLNPSMELRHNLKPYGGPTRYERDLTAESDTYAAGQPYRILEPDGRVRLAVAPGEDCEAVFRSGAPTPDDSVLYVRLAPRQGAYVDLLIPMLPTNRDVFDRELALGYDAALEEAEAFWSQTPDTAATFDVPEDYINQAIKRNLQFGQITADKDPATGDIHVVTGALGYGIATWATPISIALVGLFDTLGYHDLVATYLKVFKDAQGKVTPPGDAFERHPGYLGVPEKFFIVNWLPDHGAILWIMANHALVSGDQEFIDEYTPVIVRACEWIQYARHITGHGGAEGVMPPAGASDDESRVQVCWTDGWIYKGLCTAVRFLKEINHPRAAEFEAEARDYKETFVREFKARAARMPKWRDDEGRERTLVPYSFEDQISWQYRWITYLDTGPMHMVFAELMDADDPLMQDAVAWFREGPPTRLYRPYAALAGHMASLRHEVSSWECCYSWNIFHSWQLGDRQRFLEGMYSQFAGAMSQQTYTVTESRGGITANIFWMPAVHFARLAVIDDCIKDDELHLLRLVPLAWLTAQKESRFEHIPTRFGPVSLRARLSSDGTELRLAFSDRFRKQPAAVILHVPPIQGLKRITLNGQPLQWDTKTQSIAIR